ncbi:AraC family transcriptional regulator [Pacificispira spongiicola]|uniref:AraC family transcriptional regulator n=1 Tax=Pacificispira spongiicola TaxID=2729598 RepID=UPI002222F343|nr:AraC family transcriptional regulator [Pacificispira spongiicola]
MISDICRTLRLTGDVYFRTLFRGPFAVRVPANRRDIRFHQVLQGQCMVRLPDGDATVMLEEGDIAIIPNGAAQDLILDCDIPPIGLDAAMTAGRFTDGVLSVGETGTVTRLLCGFCAFHDGLDHPVLGALPPLMTVRQSDLGAEPWSVAALRLTAMEADLNAQGGREVLTRLLEIVFLQALRRQAVLEGSGFLAALSDASLRRGIAAIHERPAEDWTLTTLAAEAGMSRARFADRFATAVGMAPIAYLRQWRLLRARELLQSTDLDMAEIAERCGYRSVPSFSAVFKRTVGIGPGTFRRQRGGAY